MLPATAKTKIGDCEGCTTQLNVKLTLMSHNMWLCDECVTKDNDANKQALERQKALENKREPNPFLRQTADTPLIERSRQSLSIVNELRPIEGIITIREEVFNTLPPAIVEIVASIEKDDSIPKDRKLYATTARVYSDWTTLKKVIFNDEKELNEKKTILKMLHANGTNYVAQLRESERKEFVEFDKSYKPEPVKKIKPEKNPSVEKRAKAVTRKKKNTGEIIKFAKQYGVLESVVSMYWEMGMGTEEECAKKAAQITAPAKV